MRQLAENLWVVERPFSLLGAELGNRMTVIRLADGELLLHSPVVYDKTVAAELDKLGTVRYLISPNNFHGMHVPGWQTAYPEALHYSANRRKRQTPYTELDAENPPAAWQGELELHTLQGAARLNEIAFFHPASATLVLTDLAFNIGPDCSPWSRLFFRLNDAYNRFGPSRLMRSVIDGPQQLGESIRKLLSWDFDRIIVSHGRVVDTGGKDVMRQAFKAYLEAVTEPA